MKTNPFTLIPGIDPKVKAELIEIERRLEFLKNIKLNQNIMKVEKIKPFHWIIFVAIILTLLFGDSVATHLIDMAFLNLKEFFIFLGIVVLFALYVTYRLKE